MSCENLRRISRALFLIVLILSFAIYSGTAAAQEAAKKSSEPGISIQGVNIQGATLIPANVLLKAVKSYLGENKSPKTVSEIQKAIYDVYAEAGYTIVSIVTYNPDAEGIVKVYIKEGSLRNIEIEGNKNLKKESILNQLPALKRGEAINMKLLNKQIWSAMENASMEVSVKLAEVDIGLVDAIVSVNERKTVNQTVSIDNTGSKGDRNRISYRYVASNIGFQQADSLIFNYRNSAKSNKVRQYMVLYKHPFASSGDYCYIGGLHSGSSSGKVEYIGDVFGSGDLATFHYIHTLGYTKQVRTWLDFGIEKMRIKSFYGSELDSYKVDVVPVTLGYNYRYTSFSDTLQANITYLTNWERGALNNDYAYNLSRTAAIAKFHLWRGNFDYQHRFENDWMIQSRFDWQYCNQTLTPAMQFSMGGSTSVRGFNEWEFSGDKGIYGSFEVYTPYYKPGFRLVAFFDAGYFRAFDDPTMAYLFGIPQRQYISSMGLGLRVSMNKYWIFNADYAQVLRGTTSSPPTTRRLHYLFNLMY